MRTLLLLAGLALLPTTLAVAPPPLPETTIAAAPGAWLAGYLTPAAVVLPGAPITFVNGDIMRHNVVSIETGDEQQPWCPLYRPQPCPMLWSPLIDFASEVRVQGREQLVPLQVIHYFCETHPGAMEGVIVALPGVG